MSNESLVETSLGSGLAELLSLYFTLLVLFALMYWGGSRKREEVLDDLVGLLLDILLLLILLLPRLLLLRLPRLVRRSHLVVNVVVLQ
jgi:hypothetical protein